MLPDSVITEAKVSSVRTDRAFEIDFDNKKIGGIIDGREALLQAIRIALLTERYKYPVFSHSYGTDYKNAFEEGYMKAMGIVKSAICDSLLCDDRIYAVDSFEFERRGCKMIVGFKVYSVFGKLSYETEVG